MMQAKHTDMIEALYISQYGTDSNFINKLSMIQMFVIKFMLCHT